MPNNSTTSSLKRTRPAIGVPSMKIAVNTRVLLPHGMDGIGWFTYETLKRITQAHPEHEFHFIFDRAWEERFIFNTNVIPHSLFPQARHPFLFYWWFEHSIPRLLRKLKVDLFVSPDGFIPIKGSTPVLNVIHDINFHHNPQDFGFPFRQYYNYFTPRFARRSDRLATVSEFCRNDIATAYKIDPANIDVLYNGVNTSFEPLPENEKKRVRQERSDGKKYFLFMGTIIPRKNIINTLKAFDAFHESRPSEHLLLVVGNKKWWTSEMESVYNSMKQKGKVKFLGYQHPVVTRELMASADLLCFASFFEGFGIPILEAMQTHVPVITSNITATAEIAGDAAMLVDPYNPQSIADAMTTLVSDESLRSALITKGKERVQHFSWKKTADRFWNSMCKTVGER